MTERPEYDDPQRYEQLAAFDGDWRDLWWNEDFLALSARRFGLGSRRRMLDVGCGAGHWGLRLLNHLHPEATLVGVDREPSFFEGAEARAVRRGLSERASFRAGVAESLPFEDASFDVVTCQTVLIHVADAGAALREMARVLRPGGLLLAAEPDNLAGNLTHLNSAGLDRETILELLEFQLHIQAGKAALGEGDDSVGATLPAHLREAGLEGVRCFTNDCCMTLVPPYESAAMKLMLSQEGGWWRENIGLWGTRNVARRFFDGAGGSEAQFERGWAATLRFLRAVEASIADESYAGTRGFVMVLAGATRPN